MILHLQHIRLITKHLHEIPVINEKLSSGKRIDCADDDPAGQAGFRRHAGDAFGIASRRCRNARD
jgi:flagellin-like hook-associated protein FlgL